MARQRRRRLCVQQRPRADSLFPTWSLPLTWSLLPTDFGPAWVTKNAGVGIPDVSYKFPLVNYTTSVVGNLSIEYIRKIVGSAEAGAAHPPFFAYVAPKAAHEPFNPAPWYADHWDPSWPDHEPRPVSYNCSAESRADHHGNIATEDMMTAQEAEVVTGIFKNRECSIGRLGCDCAATLTVDRCCEQAGAR